MLLFSADNFGRRSRSFLTQSCFKLLAAAHLRHCLSAAPPLALARLNNPCIPYLHTVFKMEIYVKKIL